MSVENSKVDNELLLEAIKGFSEKTISVERKNILNSIADYLKVSIEERNTATLEFVCTHNSRRSQLAQIWSFAMATYFNLPVNSFSSGVEVTAFHQNAINALREQGFEITTGEGANPKNKVTMDSNGPSIFCFSKIFDDPSNPQENFAAIMVCDHADANCPFVPGAEKRISLNYTDPKRFDGSADAINGYKSTSLEIGNEMYYLYNQLA